jgi:hypothetical protein
MSAQYEVTVYDRVPTSGVVTMRQLENFLARSGWSPKDARTMAVYLNVAEPITAWLRTVDRYEDPIHTWASMSAQNVALAVERAAHFLGRQPSDVLKEVAREPT